MRVLIISLLLITVQGWGFDVPPLTAPVIDKAGMLSVDDEAALTRIIRRAHKSGKVQLQILTVPNLQNESIEQASIQIVDDWKLGGAETDNGVLILVAREERQVRIEVGQGLEGDIPDAYANQIIQDIMIPLFREGAVGAGLRAGVLQIIRLVDPPLSDEQGLETYRSYRESGSEKKASGLFFWIFLFFLIVLVSLPRRFRARSRGWGNPYGYGGMGRGGFGGGGGSWGGGGGGFSGGGASGRW